MSKKDEENIKLNAEEKRSLVAQASLELVPYVGSSLSTAYFGYKQEIRLKRLENFYKEVSELIKNSQGNLISIDEHNQEALMAIVEDLNEKVEREVIEEKRNYLKKYFQNLISTPTLKSNYDERSSFLNSLAEMSLLDSAIISEINNKERTMIKDLDLCEENEIFPIYASVSKLESFGFLKTNQTNYVVHDMKDNDDFDDERALKMIELSPLGIKFFEFCMQ